MLLENGMKYFMSCLKAAEYLQSSVLVTLFKELLADKINQLCSYQDQQVNCKFFESKTESLRAFLDIP